MFKKKKEKRHKKKKEKPTTFWGKVWYFIWEEDSIESWVVNIILAFVLIKFLVYPGIGLVMGTSHPIVAVVSGSMEHKTTHPCAIRGTGEACSQYDTSLYVLCNEHWHAKQKVDFDFFWETCGDFYEGKNITESEFKSFIFKNGFNTGDIIILRKGTSENIEVGDVIVFWGNKNFPIIHRVVEKKYDNGQYTFTTKGDHNAASDPIYETDITEERIIGKAFFRIPWLGWIKIGAFKLIEPIINLFN